MRLLRSIFTLLLLVSLWGTALSVDAHNALYHGSRELPQVADGDSGERGGTRNQSSHPGYAADTPAGYHTPCPLAVVTTSGMLPLPVLYSGGAGLLNSLSFLAEGSRHFLPSFSLESRRTRAPPPFSSFVS